jgi:hypothetical protein
LPKSCVEKGLVKTVHIPKKLEIAPITEQTKKVTKPSSR